MSHLSTDLIDDPGEYFVTDQDTAITVVEIGGKRRAIWHYAPRRFGLRLTRLQRMIDDVTGTGRWVRCDTDRCLCRDPDQG